MSQKTCCVPGCLVTKGDGVPLHRFPDPEKNAEKFNTWIANIGGDLATLDATTIYNNRRVCRNHFEDVYKYPKNRLSQLAMPVLHLPGVQAQRLKEIDHISGKFDLPNFGDSPMNTELSVNPVIEEDQPQSLVGVNVTGEAPLKQTLGDTQDNVEQSREAQNVNKTNKKAKNKTKKSKGPRLTFLQMKQYKRALKQLQRCEDEKKKLKCKYVAAKKLMKTTAFQIMCKNLSPSAKLFCQMQVTQSGKKKQGRRFTIDEKILALSLYKPSPKAYRLLGTKCIMPSRKTLQNLLRKINLRPGINEIIFENLKNRVSKMPENHKYCSLLFDEMAIGPAPLDKTHFLIESKIESVKFHTKKGLFDHFSTGLRL
ncbi:uncharacterized protein LOC135083167 [Ostrinia nubilalis]|uniref:uncharacterized protein LOC135083167 n=1 Tax=Ostrinia nubilalis TaxID=29057 RepID=UPI003082682C